MKKYIKYWAKLIKESTYDYDDYNYDDYEGETNEITSKKSFSFDDDNDNFGMNSFDNFVKNLYSDRSRQNKAYRKVCNLLQEIIKHTKCKVADESVISILSELKINIDDELNFYNNELDNYGFQISIADDVNYGRRSFGDKYIYVRLTVTDEYKLREFLKSEIR